MIEKKMLSTDFFKHVLIYLQVFVSFHYAILKKNNL